MLPQQQKAPFCYCCRFYHYYQYIVICISIHQQRQQRARSGFVLYLGARASACISSDAANTAALALVLVEHILASVACGLIYFEISSVLDASSR